MYGRGQFFIVFRRGAPNPCAICSGPVGNGPTGWHHTKGALCDACLVEEHQHLGLALIMVNLLREFGKRPAEDVEKEQGLGAILLDAARLYHRASSRAWSARRPEFLAELEASLEHQGGSDA